MVAALAAIGFTAAELQDFLDQDVRKIMAGKLFLFSHKLRVRALNHFKHD